MKLTIVSNRNGEIIATSQPTTAKGKDAPKDAWTMPLEGQLVHEVEVPDNLAEPDSIIKLHDTHIVEVNGKTATLIKRK
jgi:hypothetical protein